MKQLLILQFIIYIFLYCLSKEQNRIISARLFNDSIVVVFVMYYRINPLVNFRKEKNTRIYLSFRFVFEIQFWYT